jgi:tRNA(Ile)-lysidine synthase
VIAAPPALAPLAGMDRLNAPDRPPIAVALSGGGDSMAMLHLAKDWARLAGRRLVALTVDHGLSPASDDWTRFAAERSGRIGVPHVSLRWQGDKPSTGLPAAARMARHALLADAARSAGARVILMAHTADDLMEAALMRAAGASTPSPRLWAPSPAWPEGRGVFLLRPLLGHRRAELRAFLRRLGEAWIDDPANEDPRFSRSLARRQLDADELPLPVTPPPPPLAAVNRVREGDGGELTLPLAALAELEPAERRRLIGALAICAAGTQRPPSAASLDRLAERLRAGDTVGALAGVRIEARGDVVLFCREVGERRRGAMEAADLPKGESVFDGRFLVRAPDEGFRIAPLRGLAARLPAAERNGLRPVPAAVRGALPVVVSASGAVSCPVLSVDGAVSVAPLGLARLRAALGAVQDEAVASWSHSCLRRRCGA